MPWAAAMTEDLKGRIRLDPNISAGSLLTTLTVIGGIMFWALTKGNVADNAQSAIVSLRSDMTQQIVDLKNTVQLGQQAVQIQIAGLPDQRAQLIEVQKRGDSFAQNIHDMQVDITTLHTQLSNQGADLSSLIRSSGVTIPHAR